MSNCDKRLFFLNNIKAYIYPAFSAIIVCKCTLIKILAIKRKYQRLKSNNNQSHFFLHNYTANFLYSNSKLPIET